MSPAGRDTPAGACSLAGTPTPCGSHSMQATDPVAPIKETRMRAQHVALTAAIALAVVFAFDHYKSQKH